MIWFVRAMVVCLFTFYGTALGSPQMAIPNLTRGFFTGLVVIALSLLIGRLGKKIRAKMPVGARRAGTILYWLGNAIATFCIGLAAYVVYEGVSARVVLITASFAAPMYWAAGWGFRRALTAN